MDSLFVIIFSSWLYYLLAYSNSNSHGGSGFLNRETASDSVIKIAIFDTGLSGSHTHFTYADKNGFYGSTGQKRQVIVVKRIDWTTDNTLDDEIGHGTFVAGVLGGQSNVCPGVLFSINETSYGHRGQDDKTIEYVELYIFRVFSTDQVSYTSWFLDAFNYAIFLNIDVLNLSIGGPDYFDQPFQDKILEMSALGIIVVSAIGNDGPLWGSLNSPADMPSVIGVGGAGSNKKPLARFSSRGMTTNEIQSGGFGRVKPDILAPSVKVQSSARQGIYSTGEECSELSGTSFASPYVAGAVGLLLLAFPYVQSLQHLLNKPTIRTKWTNVASVQQVLSHSARLIRSSGSNGNVGLFEQGSGALDIPAALHYYTSTFEPHISIFPPYVSNRITHQFPTASENQRHGSGKCDYMWPWCTQQVFTSSQPLIVNFTLYNSLNVHGRIMSVLIRETYGVDAMAGQTMGHDGDSGTQNRHRSTKTVEHVISLYAPTQAHALDEHDMFDDVMGTNEISPITKLRGDVVDVNLHHKEILWPWSGFLAVSITANRPGYEGPVVLVISVMVNVDASSETFMDCRIKNGVYECTTGEKTFVHESAEWKRSKPATIHLYISKPFPRDKRLLWDVYHHLNYPTPYVIRDDIHGLSGDTLDWLGDHPYTNFRIPYNFLVEQGYSVEILRNCWVCFDGALYKALLLVDTEDSFAMVELDKLEHDVRAFGLSILVVSDWYDEKVMTQSNYYDQNTRSEWLSVIGGSNIPAINMLLTRFGGQFGLNAYEGKFDVGNSEVVFGSGNVLTQWPVGGLILHPGATNFTLSLHFAKSNELKEEEPPKLRGSVRRVDTLTTPGYVGGFLNIPLFQNSSMGKGTSDAAGGKVVVYGDSSCLDTQSHPDFLPERNKGCLTLLHMFLDFIQTGTVVDPGGTQGLSQDPRHGIVERVSKQFTQLPKRRQQLNQREYRQMSLIKEEFRRYSKVEQLNQESEYIGDTFRKKYCDVL